MARFGYAKDGGTFATFGRVPSLPGRIGQPTGLGLPGQFGQRGGPIGLRFDDRATLDRPGALRHNGLEADLVEPEPRLALARRLHVDSQLIGTLATRQQAQIDGRHMPLPIGHDIAGAQRVELVALKTVVNIDDIVALRSVRSAL